MTIQINEKLLIMLVTTEWHNMGSKDLGPGWETVASSGKLESANCRLVEAIY